MIKKINSSIIGLGFGETHLKCFKKNRFTKILKICDLNVSKKKYFEKKYKVDFTKKYKEITNDKDVNLITIATYDDSHFKILKESIKAKKNVFVEKPICQTFKQLNEIKSLLKKNKKIFFSTNMVLRNHPKFKKIHRIVKSGKIGKIFHIEGEYNYGRFEKILRGWRGRIKNYSVTQGGGIHIIDLIQWYVGKKIEKVIGIDNNINSKMSSFKNSDTTTALLKFKSGVTAKITSNFPIKTFHHHVLNIHGTKGSIFSSHEDIVVHTLTKKNKKKEKINFKKDKNYKFGVLDNFIYQILGKKKPLFDKNTIFNNMEIAFAIDRSLKTKKWEKV